MTKDFKAQFQPGDLVIIQKNGGDARLPVGTTGTVLKASNPFYSFVHFSNQKELHIINEYLEICNESC